MSDSHHVKINQMKKLLHLLQRPINISYLRLCIGVGVFIFISKVFVLQLTSGVGDILGMLFIDFGTLILAVATLIGSLIFAVRYFKREGIKALYPLCVSLTTCVLLFVIPFGAIAIDIDFYVHLNDREKLINEIQGSGPVRQASEYKNVLTRDRVSIERGEDGQINVFFVVFSGILDNFSGFIYRSDTMQPKRNDFNCDYFEIKEMREHWFWVACN